MSHNLFESNSYEVILDTESETIFSSLSTDTLKLKISHKTKSNQGNGCLQYQCIIKYSQIQQKLHQYFENLKQLNDYLKKSQNVKIDWDKGNLDIVTKGPTKKASYMLLAQFKLQRIQKFGDINASSSQAQQWIDHLANEIIGIIQSKSKIKDRADSEKIIVSKDELDTSIQNLRKQMTQQLQFIKTELNTLKQSQKQTQKVIQNNCISQASQNQTLLSHQRLLKQVKTEQQKFTQILQNLQKSQQRDNTLEMLVTKCQQITKQIEEINKQIQQIKETYTSNIKQLDFGKQILNKELKKMQQIWREQIDYKFKQFGQLFSKKQQIDTIIKKIQNMGAKIQNLMAQSLKKGERSQMLQQKLFLQQKKLSQIEGKIEKQKSEQQNPKDLSPKKGSSDILTPSGNPIMAQSWVDQDCSHFGRVTINKNIITMASFGNARIFSKITIESKPRFSILVSSMSKCMAIGIIDCIYKQSVILSEETNSIIYQSDRKFYNGTKQMEKKGEGFNKDEIVTVLIDSELGTILWKVGNGLRYSWQSDQLRNKKIKWVPYIKMFDKGDKVQLLQ